MRIVGNEMMDILRGMGFSIGEGGEVEDEWDVLCWMKFGEEDGGGEMEDRLLIESEGEIIVGRERCCVERGVMEV